MDEYKKPYLALFNALSDIAAEIDRQNYGAAKQLIEKAQQKAEELFICEDADDE